MSRADSCWQHRSRPPCSTLGAGLGHATAGPCGEAAEAVSRPPHSRGGPGTKIPRLPGTGQRARGNRSIIQGPTRPFTRGRHKHGPVRGDALPCCHPHLLELLEEGLTHGVFITTPDLYQSPTSTPVLPALTVNTTPPAHKCWGSTKMASTRLKPGASGRHRSGTRLAGGR